ncbi:Hint domain-containing protein [Paracoccaceae bacterium GXU_MW_L88]
MPTYDYPGYDDDQITWPGGSVSEGDTITFTQPTDHLVSITDNDSRFQDGTDDRDDEDNSQQVEVFDENGVLEASGQVQPRERIVLEDADGNQYIMHRVYIRSEPTGNEYFYVFEDPGPELNVQYSVIDVSRPNSEPYWLPGEVTCFTRGVEVLTPDGYQRVERLKAGDLVTTRDHGPQPILWVARRFFSWSDMLADPRRAPFEVAADAFGRDQPKRPLLFSRQHRLLVTPPARGSDDATSEMLAPVVALEDGTRIRRVVPALGVEYIHLVFAQHEIVDAEGLATESMLLTAYSRDASGMDAQDDAALFDDLPDVTHAAPARPILSNKSARNLIAEGALLSDPVAEDVI